MDYRSPIEVYTHEPMFKEMEDGIMRATVSCGVQIDKDELIRALAYDREQYRAGYEAAERKYKRPVGEWIDRMAEHKEREDVINVRECSICHACYVRRYPSSLGFEEEIPNYCPNCGADMRGVEE